jgi:hypothetical protein
MMIMIMMMMMMTSVDKSVEGSARESEAATVYFYEVILVVHLQ